MNGLVTTDDKADREYLRNNKYRINWLIKHGPYKPIVCLDLKMNGFLYEIRSYMRREFIRQLVI